MADKKLSEFFGDNYEIRRTKNPNEPFQVWSGKDNPEDHFVDQEAGNLELYNQIEARQPKKWDYDAKKGTLSLGDKTVKMKDIFPDIKASSFKDSSLSPGQYGLTALALTAANEGEGHNNDSWSTYWAKNTLPGSFKGKDVTSNSFFSSPEAVKKISEQMTDPSTGFGGITKYESKPSGWDKVPALAFDVALMAMGVPPIASGAMSGAANASASGGNILKGAATGGIMGGVSQYASKFLPQLNSSSAFLNKMASGAERGALLSGLRGKSMKEGAISGGIGGAVGSMIPQQVNPYLRYMGGASSLYNMYNQSNRSTPQYNTNRRVR